MHNSLAMKDQRNLPLRLLGTIREGIGYVCLCVCTCVRRHAQMCLCASMRLCHLVNADLGLFGPVGFIVVCGTRVDVWLRPPRPVEDQDAPWSSEGMETFRLCHACHSCFSPVWALILKCFHAHLLFVRMMTELIP